MRATSCDLRLAHLMLKFGVTAVCGLLVPSLSQADWPPLFRGSQLYDSGYWATNAPYRDGGPNAAAVADLSGDGLPDLIVADTYVTDSNGFLMTQNSVSVLLHTGDTGVAPLFGPKTHFPCGSGPAAIAIADMNLDGKPDVVTANRANSISVLFGAGDGTLAPPVTYNLPQWPGLRVRVADLNNDTWPDVVVPATEGQDGTGRIGVMLGIGNGALGSYTTYENPTQSTFYGVALGDVTGDGAVDVVAAADNLNVEIFEGDNNGGFTFVGSLISPPGTTPLDVALGHLNGDANLDIVTAAAHATGLFAVYIGTGGGSFQPYVSYPLVTHSPGSLALDDLDGDGHLDIASGPYFYMAERYSVAVVHGTGTGTFGAPSFYAATPHLGPIVLSDVNMNGRPDLIGPTWGNQSFNARSHTACVLLDDGAGGFQSTAWSLDLRKPFREAIVDFNRDGKPDVAYSDSATVRIAVGNGSGTFTDIGGPDVPPPLGEVVTADWNRDGRPDLAVQSGANIRAYTSDADGALTFAFGIGQGRLHPRSVVDLNRDGRLDLVTTRITIPPLNPPANALRTWIQAVDGTFPLTQSLTPSGQAQSLAHGDWNRDGKPDVMVAMATGLSIFTGTGSGTLDAEVSVATGRNYQDLCAGDFNRDGKLDVAALDSLAGQSGTRGIDVFLGDGLGGFGPPASRGTLEQNGYRIESWDANVDGVPDLVASMYSDPDPILGVGAVRFGSVEAHLGDGAGGFGLRSAYTIGTTVGFPAGPHFAAGDVNGDDLPDVISTARTLTSDGLNVRTSLQTLLGIPPNQGNGLNPKTDYPSIASTSRVAIGDLNRDGILDVVTGSRVSPGVAVRLGTGSGALGPSANVTQSVGVWQVKLGDMNRDGILDLVVGRTSLGPPEMVSVMLGVGDGTFGPRIDHAIGAVGEFEIADMDRDGIPDVVAGQAQLGTVRVLRGVGDGTLTALAGGTIPWVYDLETVDVNRDGILDVVAVGGNLHVLNGNGDGTLANSTTIALGSPSLQTVCVGDFDRDGLPDVATGDAGSSIYVAWGSANPPFSSYVTSYTPASAWDMQVGTAEADGRPFLYLSAYGAQVLIFEQTGTPGQFASVGSYPVGFDPESIALADLNRDGLLDVVTTNSDPGEISVLLHGANVVTGVAAMPPAVPRPRLYQNYPNPFNPSTTLWFSTPEAGAAQLRVFDIQGRLVATLVDGLVPAGEHRVRWDGLSDRGSRTASGIYFYRLSTSTGYRESRRMVMLK